MHKDNHIDNLRDCRLVLIEPSKKRGILVRLVHQLHYLQGQPSHLHCNGHGQHDECRFRVAVYFLLVIPEVDGDVHNKEDEADELQEEANDKKDVVVHFNYYKQEN